MCTTRPHEHTCLIRLLILIEHLYLSGMCCDVASKNKYQKAISSKEIGLHSKNMITIAC